MREIIFDTETTGFDPASGDRLVEIGCIELINRVPSGLTFHAYYHPERDMPAAAYNVHGLSADFLAKYPVFAKGAAELLEFLGDSPLVAHNARFDFGFLNHELKLCGLPDVSMDRMIDTVAIARTLHPGAKHSLDALCTRYGIDRSHRVKHGALLDAELLAQLYIELTGGRQIGLGLAQEEAKQIVGAELTASAMVRPVRPARVFTASAAELERHAAFVATLKEPLWHQEA
ncbi:MULTISPECIES: DNA polymerase III subunit epsilon [Sphingobium]|jgi:DNA polymerase-3 subunit epsilon|uniref:DNA polymerase III subunit epsilon n=1 Tax=Sphingobium limneticum TaxID=1007511 RepID=A0A5J5HVQ1_9SPHN|nr:MULTISPECIES: DNA polymerase III subunit epsilon [Sphingobium]MBU0933385.1 DNA polymerase III subunit epsilon [Alphaproteobacteria bacterium]KAA9013741.1 DNA polymerase III subunit epsilon [Sphingobium limneticum]KAA9017175.1 DNA polymerase III subunit epsilon [Sphingobium limneticum]KAA9026819.1 DNA polymerase III subunit epsilon [Sphingobium limneticum]BBD01326.1 DNA polymerase III subunit epsilon [Sphingobium sp. YG1]